MAAAKQPSFLPGLPRPHNALEESCISWGSGEGQAQEINKIVATPALVKVEMKAKKVAGKDKSDKKYKQKGKG